PHLALASFPTRRSSDLSLVLWPLHHHSFGNLGCEGQLGRGKREGFLHGLCFNTFDFEQDAARLNVCNPVFDTTFTATLTNFERLDRKSTRLNSSHVKMS